MRIIINGRGLDRAMNGIPRYITEVISSLDKQSDIVENEVEVVIPEGTEISLSLNNIKITELKNCKAWDFRAAEAYAKKNNALYVNLASKGVVYKNSIATIHDIRVLRESCGLSIREIKNYLKIKISYTLAVNNAKHLVTVSEFSKKEMMEYFQLPSSKISVIGNGWEHLENLVSDESIFDEYPDIKKGQYYFAIGSIAPHKNFKWIIKNKKKHPDTSFVIMGKVDESLWKNNSTEFDGVTYVGYQSDARMAALMRNAKALVFPSLYEGFGIPPLEALAYGIPAIVADIPVMREIFGDSVHYLDVNDTEIDLDQVLQEKVLLPEMVLNEHSWKSAGEKWWTLIKKRNER